MEFKSVKTNEPSFDGVNYLAIIKYLNKYSYSFVFFDGDNWYPDNGEVIAFTESDPKQIIHDLLLKNAT